MNPKCQYEVAKCKGARGLRVQPKFHCIFTVISISFLTTGDSKEVVMPFTSSVFSRQGIALP